MLVIIRRSCTISSVTVVALVLIFILIMAKQLKDIYEQNKKNQRFQLYNSFLSDVSESMTDLETNINKSSVALQKLNSVLEKQKKISKNIHTPKSH